MSDLEGTKLTKAGGELQPKYLKGGAEGDVIQIARYS
jgi:hypothetical protein